MQELQARLLLVLSGVPGCELDVECLSWIGGPKRKQKKKKNEAKKCISCPAGVLCQNFFSITRCDTAVNLHITDPQCGHYVFALTVTAFINRILQLSIGLNRKKDAYSFFFWRFIEPHWPTSHSKSTFSFVFVCVWETGWLSPYPLRQRALPKQTGSLQGVRHLAPDTGEETCPHTLLSSACGHARVAPASPHPPDLTHTLDRLALYWLHNRERGRLSPPACPSVLLSLSKPIMSTFFTLKQVYITSKRMKWRIS